jgi:hypothetical protein
LRSRVRDSFPAPNFSQAQRLSGYAKLFKVVKYPACQTYRPDGETGRHKGLKIPRRKVCRFDSGSGHQYNYLKTSL